MSYAGHRSFLFLGSVCVHAVDHSTKGIVRYDTIHVLMSKQGQTNKQTNKQTRQSNTGSHFSKEK